MKIKNTISSVEEKNVTEKYTGNITSGNNPSLWLLPEPLAYRQPNGDLTTEVLVIGGGIAGITTAYCLAKEGKKVVLVEDGYLGSGETGRTTAHFTYALDDRYYELENTFGKEATKLIANSHKMAIDWVESTIEINNIDCDFKRIDGFLFSSPSDEEENLEKEFQAVIDTGLPVEMLYSTPDINYGEDKKCIKFPNQGQLHIMKYLKGMADAIEALGGRIFTQTKAEKISDIGAVINGFSVRAEHIVVATNTPINDLVTIHTKQWPYRTYVIGSKIPKGSLPYSLWWDTGDMNSRWITKPYHYVRLAEFDNEYDILIAGGEDHRTGQADEENIPENERYHVLLQWVKRHFPVFEKIDFKWSGQVMEPIDSIAFIGKNPGDKNIYVITGDSGNGMTYGTLGGLIIRDIILEKDNPLINIYDPTRITLSTSGDYIKEVVNMIAQLGDWLTPEMVKEVKQIRPGDGAIIVSGMKKIAMYRDEQNQLHSFSAVCPHLGGILQWNRDEKTFDCPLHGSRFSAEGKVINGPASVNIEQIEN